MLIFHIRAIVLCYSFFFLLSHFEVNAQFTSTQSGNWTDCETWGFGGGCTATAGVTYPDINDNVTVSATHVVLIDATNGYNAQSVGVAAVISGSGINGFYHNGTIDVAGTLDVDNIPLITTNNVTINGNIISDEDYFILGNTIINDIGNNTAIFSDDIILSGSAVFTTNIAISIDDDIYLDGTLAAICGTGSTNLGNNTTSLIDYINGATSAQICANLAITNCTTCPINLPTSGDNISVTGNGTIIQNADVTPSVVDLTDFGTASIGGGSITNSFIIENIGADDLILQNTPIVILTGTDAASFSIITQPVTNTVSSGSSVFFEVSFLPSTIGTKNATIEIISNDNSIRNYTFSITAEAVAANPEIEVFGNNILINSGDNTPELSDNTDFDNVPTGNSSSKLFSINNTGSNSLLLTGSPRINISGTDASSFSVTVQPSSSITSGSSSSYQLTFNPLTAGLKQATITIQTNDPDEAVFTYDIQGTGIDTEINITGNGNNINNGATTTSTSNSTEFGDILVGNNTIQTFTIENLGLKNLLLSGSPIISIIGVNASEFAVTSTPSNNIGSGSSSNFDITFTPSSVGTKSATIIIANNDSDENPYNFAITGTGTQPDMTVLGNTITINNNDITPNTADFSDFGDARTDGQTVTRTFSIENNGTADLNISLPVTISGTAAADFSVNVQPAATVAPGGNTSFQITFDPSAIGSRDAAISFSSDDIDDPNFSFAITGNGIQPDMTVSGNTITINNNDITPNTADFSDFGDARTDGQTVIRTFSIENNGTADLNISLPVTISGTAAADFSVNVQPAATVAPGSATSFQVTFDPSAIGNRDAAINFSSDDIDDPNFSFAISGNGIQPDMTVLGNTITISNNDITPSTADFSDFGDARTDGQTVIRTFSIENNGTADLNISLPVTISGTAAADFSVSVQPAATVAPGGTTSFQVTFDPSAIGSRDAAINFSSDDIDDPNFSFAITGNGIQPDMTVLGNTITINNNDITPNTADFSDFGDARTDGQTVIRTFSIENNGSATLNISLPVTISGAAAADFSVSVQPAATVVPGGNTSFQVTFDPSVIGNRDAAISFSSDDIDDPNFSFAITGNGIQPDMNVLGNTVTISNNDITPSAADFSDFGDARTDGQTVTRTFSIENNGSATLNISLPVTISGTAATDFSVSVQPAATVAPGSATSFQVTFDPSAIGNRDAAISFSSDDIDDPNFSFAITGNGIQPDMNVLGNTVTISNNDITPSAADFSDFGDARTDGQTVTRTFSIENNGSATLNISLPVTISGTAAADFSVSVQPAATVAPGGNTSFQVTFDPSAIGNRDAAIGFSSDDIDDPNFSFAITGNGIQPDMSVLGNTVTISNNDITPSAADFSDFGDARTDGQTVTRTFSIENNGSATLNISLPVTISGTAAADFSVSVQPAATVAPGGNTSFQVTFDPSVIGNRDAAIGFSSDDIDDPNFSFAITGNGIQPDMSVLGNTVTISNNDITPSAADFSDFGDARTDGQTVTRTFSIENNGSATLNISLPVTISGAAAADFSVNVQPAATVAPGGNTSFQVTFDPSVIGNRDAAISFSSDDIDDPNFSFAITGNGIQPDMNVLGNTVTINNNDITPSAADFSDFGDARTDGQTVTRTFSIENNGSATLNISLPVTISGTAAADFSVSVQPAATVAPGGNTSFQVTFDPSAIGSRDATINFSSDDIDDPNFSFAITGNGIQPDMTVLGNTITISNNDITPNTADFSDFGDARTDGQTVIRTFSIENNGTADLNISLPVAISGTAAADFSVNVQPAATVAPGGSTSFQVTFDPSAIGNRDATIDFSSDDIDDPNFSFAITGNGIQPDMTVLGNTVTISNNDITPSTADFSDFGDARTDGQTVIRTFSIGNNGTADLNISLPVTISGAAAADFSVNVQPAATVAPGGNTSFQVTFDPSAIGSRDAAISFSSDDIDDPNFSFTITGNGIQPDMTVLGNTITISNSDITPSAADFSDFGDARTDGQTVIRTFSIGNNGTADLNISLPVTISGAAAADFSVNVQPAATVAPGGNTSFQVTFDPSAIGNRDAAINFSSDDIDDPNFSFAITGNGTIPEVLVESNSNIIQNGSFIPSINNNTDFGNSIAAFQTVENIFYLKNIGNSTLTLVGTQIEISGVHESEFSLNTTNTNNMIPAGDSTLFSIVFMPQSPGEKNASILIYSDDPENNTYGFNIKGLGLEQFPIVENDSFLIIKNEVTTLDVIANDIHPGGHALTAQIITPPKKGFANIENNQIIYNPNLEFTGEDSLVYSMCDFNNLCSEATVYLSIVENNKPIANDDYVNVITNSQILITPQENDVELTNGTLLTSIIIPPVNGSYNLINENEINYTPNKNFIGLDVITYEICNIEGLCDTASIFIDINTFNNKPIANNDTINLFENETLNFEVLPNDINPGDDQLTVSIISNPANGNISLQGNTFFYRPRNDFSGNDFFQYQICNSIELCDTGFVAIFVNPKTPPKANSDIYSTISGGTIELDLLANDTDEENNIDLNSLQIIAEPTNGELVDLGNGVFQYQSSPFFVGNESFVYQICDSTSLCDSDTVFILVNAPESDLVEISKGFSPNGDGINDTWNIQGLEFFPRNIIKVFSKDGNIVYEATGYNNTTVFWDGRTSHPLHFGNGNIDRGTYFYIIDLGNGENPRSGYIEIKY